MTCCGLLRNAKTSILSNLLSTNRSGSASGAAPTSILSNLLSISCPGPASGAASTSIQAQTDISATTGSFSFQSYHLPLSITLQPPRHQSPRSNLRSNFRISFQLNPSTNQHLYNSWVFFFSIIHLPLSTTSLWVLQTKRYATILLTRHSPEHSDSRQHQQKAASVLHIPSRPTSKIIQPFPTSSGAIRKPSEAIKAGCFCASHPFKTDSQDHSHLSNLLRSHLGAIRSHQSLLHLQATRSGAHCPSIHNSSGTLTNSWC